MGATGDVALSQRDSAENVRNTGINESRLVSFTRTSREVALARDYWLVALLRKKLNDTIDWRSFDEKVASRSGSSERVR